MKRPEPPLLGLSFYFADISEADAFSRLVMALLHMGAKFTGHASVHRGAGVRNRPFASTIDEPIPEPVTLDISVMTQILTEPDIRVIEIYIDGAIGIARDTAEIISYVSISSEASHTDRHPLAIWTEGWLFEGTFPKKYPKRSRKAGRQVYELFCSLIESEKPAYAAITTEIFLECPADLRRDPRSYAFLDFFVSGKFLGTSNLTKIQKIFHGAYVEEVGDGLYISCTKNFNPEGISLDPEDATWHSLQVAKLIAYLGQQ
jgi:hypothetical protein